jgi:hypothetical protein
MTSRRRRLELAPAKRRKQRQPLNDHRALIALSHALESMAGEDPAVIAARSRQVITGPQSQIDTAVDRIEVFSLMRPGLPPGTSEAPMTLLSGIYSRRIDPGSAGTGRPRFWAANGLIHHLVGRFSFP